MDCGVSTSPHQLEKTSSQLWQEDAASKKQSMDGTLEKSEIKFKVIKKSTAKK